MDQILKEDINNACEVTPVHAEDVKLTTESATHQPKSTSVSVLIDYLKSHDSLDLTSNKSVYMVSI